VPKSVEKKPVAVPVFVPQTEVTGKMYPHQIEAFNQFKDETEIMLFMEMGTGKSLVALRIAGYKFKKGLIDALLIVAPNDVHCITGDTTIWYKHGMIYKESTVADLYSLFHTQRTEPFYIRGLVNGYFGMLEIQDVVDIGVKECYRVTLANGKHLDCTLDEKLLTSNGYIELAELQVGDTVLCNGKEACCPDCGSTDIIKQRPRHGKPKWEGYCKSCAYKRARSTFNKENIGTCSICGKTDTIVYQDGLCVSCNKLLQMPDDEYEAKNRPYIICTGAQTIGHTRRGGNQPGVWKHIMVVEMYLGRKLKPGEHVHHINGNTYDNRIENLCIVSPSRHASLHKSTETGRFIEEMQQPTVSKIISIDSIGLREVYDITTGGEHNFVANGIVVHNCQWAHEQVPLWLDCPYNIQCLFGRGGSKVAYPFDEDPEFLQVVSVNVDTFSTPEKWKDIAEWANSRRTMIILDEATVIKNVTAQRTQRLLHSFNDNTYRKRTLIKSIPKTVARAILTGTPVTNGPMDMWSMAEFVRPNFFNRNWYSFQAHFGMFVTIAVGDRPVKIPLSEEWWEVIKSMTSFVEAQAVSGCSEDMFQVIHSQDKYEGPYKHADELRELIRPVSYFKQLRDCVEMPAEIRTVRELIMTPELEKCYDDMVTKLMTKYEDHVMTAKNSLSAIIRLQQICSGFICDKSFGQDVDEEASAVDRMFGLSEEEDILPDEIQWIGKSNPKLDMLYRDLDELVKPAIILTRFTAEADRIYNDIHKKYRTMLVTGWKRIGTMEEFKDGKYDVMVANSAVVNRGFNLQNSHVMLFYSNTFSLETRLQAEGRIFRLGQTFPCEYIDYCYPGTVDEKITAALKMKRNLLDYIRDTNNIKEIVE
jgi:superfamily II DNA or RNA helicase